LGLPLPSLSLWSLLLLLLLLRDADAGRVGKKYIMSVQLTYWPHHRPSGSDFYFILILFFFTQGKKEGKDRTVEGAAAASRGRAASQPLSLSERLFPFFLPPLSFPVPLISA
jgi:hypothetical protein